MLTEPIIRRLILSRYLFELALQNVRVEQETGDAACVNLLQDATEIFFVAALDHRNIAVKPRTDFPQYLDKLSEALDGELPYRRRLQEINKVRVASKHDGIFPNRKEINGYITDTRKFLEEMCPKIFGVEYWTISLVDLLDAGEAKVFLQAAEKLHKAGNYAECLIECRKAFFVTFETEYDTQTALKNEFPIFASKAPYYARDKDYIRKNVKDHFDYVVLDHSQIDRDLVKEGIDHTSFWNVWRLTPHVYRHKKDDPWRVKRSPRLHAVAGFKERSALVLSTMISILLARQNTKNAARYVTAPHYLEVKVKNGAKLYERANKNGAVTGILAEGVKKVAIDYATQGLHDDDWYWSAFYAKPEGPLSVISGYILQEELIFEE